MFKFVKILILYAITPFSPGFVYAQIKQPVRWDFSWVQTSDQEVHINFDVSIENGWHIYSQYMEEGGPVPTKFTFETSDDYTLDGNVQENSEPIETFDPTFSMPVTWFENSAIFTQKIKMRSSSATIRGKVLFMACSEFECLVPQEKEFAIDVKLRVNEKQSPTIKKTSVIIASEDKGTELKASDTAKLDAGSTKEVRTSVPELSAGDQRQDDNAQYTGWNVFLLGFAGGLIALLMPCVFPMIPFTISYFLRSGGSHRRQIGMATLYGISITVIYVGLGLLITMLFGADALNALSTNGLVNFFFFLLLIVFAASLLGGFDITLPSSWINKADAQSGRKGFAGIFFMAATLALVSFSCTGPLVGTLLVTSIKMGSLFLPALGMLGFSLALALPFTLFAMFPAWLKSLPKSGGWLNTVKVVLGFLELALALKFLSNVDLAYHWRWFDREVFLVLWIIIFGLLGFYLMGKIRLPHDTDLKYVSPVRLFLAIVSLAFTLYMIPGLWGAPLKSIAAFLPPQSTQDFDLYSTSLIPAAFTKESSRVASVTKKYADLFEAPLGINAFFDFEEGLAYARKVNKPVLIDFTGHACVNCRKMETTVWPVPDVLSIIKNDFVVIQLYVDDKTELPLSDQVVSNYSGKKLVTLGNKWSDLQASAFNTNSQPYYVLLSPDGKELVPPSGADYSAEKFTHFLQEGLKEFHKISFTN